MIVCFRCSRETKENLDNLIASGVYTDYGEVISVAVANLAILESEVRGKGSIVIGTSHETTSTRKNPSASDVKNSPFLGEVSRTNRMEALAVPDIFQLNGVPESPSRYANLPTDVWVKGQGIPIDRWVFGQYNRLLPAKASCRALARESIGRKGIKIEELSSKIVEKAAALGDLLKHYDIQHNIARDDLLSTAFPTTDNDKSRLRFDNQFIVSINREGQLSGLLVDYKLINRINTRDTRLLLTEPGWRFALLPNPVLDGDWGESLQKFSEDEQDFLVDHIARNVPAEDFAFHAILLAIKQGANTPDSMDDFFRERSGLRIERDISPSYVSTQRSGAVSRMTDLGLVVRVRDGVKVSYDMTGSGEEYYAKRGH